MQSFSLNADINEVVRSEISDARPTTEIGKFWWSEVWIKTLEGRTEEETNIDAYGYTCERNTKMAVGSREVALLTVEEIDSGLRGVADTVASYVDTNVDTIIESSEVQTLVDQFLAFHEELLIDEGVNLWKVLKVATRNHNMRMVDKLRDIIARHNVEELIEGVLKIGSV